MRGAHIPQWHTKINDYSTSRREDTEQNGRPSKKISHDY